MQVPNTGAPHRGLFRLACVACALATLVLLTFGAPAAALSFSTSTGISLPGVHLHCPTNKLARAEIAADVIHVRPAIQPGALVLRRAMDLPLPVGSLLTHREQPVLLCGFLRPPPAL